MNVLEHENPNEVSWRKVFSFMYSFTHSLTVLNTYLITGTMFMSKEEGSS